MSVPRDPQEPITPELWVELRERYPHANRLAVAFRLARDVETCASLLRGEPVDPTLIDSDSLAWAQRQSFVQLVRPIETLIGEAA